MEVGVAAALASGVQEGVAAAADALRKSEATAELLAGQVDELTA